MNRQLPLALLRNRVCQRALLTCAILLALIGAADPLGAARRMATTLQADGALFVPLIVSPVPGTNYFVDCTGGNDANSGRATTAAWKSLEKARTAPLTPGDRLYFKRGCTWTGPLYLDWNGGTNRPIVIDAYGSGYLPIIQNAQYNVIVRGTNLLIQNLAARGTPQSYDPGCQNQPKGWQLGFRFEPGASYNTLRYSQATGLTHGVKITSGAHHITIVNNVFAGNNLMYILDASNTNNDAGANGIVVEGDDNEIAYNQISGSDACSFDYGRDGSAVEVYGGQRNRVHHNTATNNNTFTELGVSRSADNTFAYNLVMSSTPKANFLITEGASGGRGPVLRTKAYNNTVYLTDPSSIAINCDGGCATNILTLKNNIVWSEGKIGYTDRPCDEGYNLFWRTDGKPGIFFPTPSNMSSTSHIANPQFVKPSVGGGDFRLMAASPARDVGTALSVQSGFGIDLAGVTVPQGAGVDIGAYEYKP
ncbi:MAG TPA: choice-of-anchor Q domain-containing protein [Roseiflexaceae bacterium]|nr:choice-of-anchor Q domain-containing protein [Roseiflexaceae bacterium]